jgi:MoCo/4Fe-4S cofactor protein with predicted Tat translocation signal
MNTDIRESNSLTELATRIRTSHEAVRAVMKSAVEKAIETGDLLLKAKAQLKHGEWTPWLRDHCEISERTARVYMFLAKNQQSIQAQGIADLSLNKVVRLLAAPKKEDNYFPEHIAEIETFYAETKMKMTELAKCLYEVRDNLGSDEFEKWLEREFPEPVEELEDEVSELIKKAILAMVEIVDEEVDASRAENKKIN